MGKVAHSDRFLLIGSRSEFLGHQTNDDSEHAGCSGSMVVRVI